MPCAHDGIHIRNRKWDVNKVTKQRTDGLALLQEKRDA